MIVSSLQPLQLKFCKQEIKSTNSEPAGNLVTPEVISSARENFYASSIGAYFLRFVTFGSGIELVEKNNYEKHQWSHNRKK